MFDPDVFRARHRIQVVDAGNQKNGYAARVVESRPGTTKEYTAYNSELQYQSAGVFPQAADARRHGNRWIDAKVKQLVRIDELRSSRGLELADRLAMVADDKKRVKDEVGELRAEDKGLDFSHDHLIAEARNPDVELTFSPGGADFSVFDANSISDGSLSPQGKPTKDTRQTEMFDDDGEPVEVEEGDGEASPEAEENARAAKAKAKDKAEAEEKAKTEPNGKDKAPKKTGAKKAAAKKSGKKAAAKKASKAKPESEKPTEPEKPAANTTPRGYNPNRIKWPDETPKPIDGANDMIPSYDGPKVNDEHPDKCKCGGTMTYRDPKVGSPHWKCCECALTRAAKDDGGDKPI